MDMFIEVVVFVLVAGDDVFALLICDEDLEYGARRFWCLLVGTCARSVRKSCPKCDSQRAYETIGFLLIRKHYLLRRALDISV